MRRLLCRYRITFLVRLSIFGVLWVLLAGPAFAQTITVHPPSLPPGTAGTAYSQTISADDGDDDPGGPDADDIFTFAVTSGSLPPGLSLDANSGVLSGTPTTAGSYPVTITASNPTSGSGSQAYTIVIGTDGALTINPASLPNGMQGVAYSQTVTASGGTGPYTYSISSGSLPAGLTLNASSGAISGTPTGSGLASFTVHAQDSAGNTGNRAYTINIGTNSLTLSPASLPNGTQGTAYSQTVIASGGSGGYSYSITSGSLPAGLTLNASTGVIGGTPTATGSSTFTVQAVDSSANTGSRSYTINIGGAAALTLSPSTLANGMQGVAYSQTVTASGGNGAYTYTISSGALPAGLTLNAGTGVISGTPTGSGSSTFTVHALDSDGNAGARSYTVNIGTASLTLNPASLPNGTQGVAYSQTVVASGGSGGYSYSVTSGSLPAGLTLNASTGVIGGTPTATGSSTFTVQAVDSIANTGSRSYTINIGAGGALTVAPNNLPNGTLGSPYTQTVTATGGTGPYRFRLFAGALPPGLTLDPNTGVISGTPTSSGPANFTIEATDSSGNTGTHSFSVTIGTVALTVNPTNLPGGARGTAYTQTVTATGGTGPYTYSLVGGSLPAGLSLSGAGVISGTPTANGTSSFTVQAVDSSGNSGTRALSITIGAPTITIDPSKLPPALAGHHYSQRLTASGGTGPYTYAIVAGSLPPGLTLNPATGVISGTGGGTATFTVQATDSLGNVGSWQYTLRNHADPARDPQVQGLVSAQVSAAQRFAATQITNITQHLEGLHDSFSPCSFNFGIALPIDPNLPPAGPYAAPAYGGPVGLAANGTQPPTPEDGPVTTGALPPPAPGVAAGPLPPPPPHLRPRAIECAGDWQPAFWTGGAFQFGKMTPSGPADSNKFSSAGLTAGVDVRLDRNLIVGAALGYGADHTDVADNGTRSSADSFSGALYASMHLLDHLYLDGAIGGGSLGYANNRWLSGLNEINTGNRDGGYWFATLQTSFEMRFDALKIAPYLRAEYMRASLGSYGETGSDELLNYNAVNFSALSGTLGLRGSYDIQTAYGIVTPYGRLEYRATSQSAYDQPMYYLDLGPALTSTWSQPASSFGATTGALGLRVRTIGGLSAELEYGVTGGSNDLMAQTIRGQLRLPF